MRLFVRSQASLPAPHSYLAGLCLNFPPGSHAQVPPSWYHIRSKPLHPSRSASH